MFVANMDYIPRAYLKKQTTTKMAEFVWGTNQHNISKETEMNKGRAHPQSPKLAAREKTGQVKTMKLLQATLRHQLTENL